MVFMVHKTKQMELSQLPTDWLVLDDLVMENIFELLSHRDRFNASLVCRRWSSCFELPKVWRYVVIDGHWLTKTVNIVANNDEHHSRVLDYERVANCLQRIGQHIRHVHIRQTKDFVSLYQFFIFSGWYFGYKMQGTNIHKLTFDFPCDQALEFQPNGIKLFGIGGQLMNSFKQMLSETKKLREFELFDLVLDKYEANSLMDHICLCLNQSIKILSVINLTINHCPLQQVSMLTNLEVLKISPQNIDDSMLRHLTQSKLKHLHIVQNENTPRTVMPCSVKAWLQFKHLARDNLRTHLEAISKENEECDLLIQPDAFIHSIKCKNVKKGVKAKIIENYSNCLMAYSDENSIICDSDMIELVSKCLHLKTLNIDRPITTCALLLIIAFGKNLQNIFIRNSNAKIEYEEWITEFCENNGLDHQWVQENYRSISQVELAITKRLGKPWHFLP